MYNIAIGGISTECTSYSKKEQEKKDFFRIKGEELVNYINFKFNNYPCIKVHPIFFEYSIPGGPIKYNYFVKIKNQFINKIKKIKNLDGILLIMHGAIFINKIKDPEGYFIKEIRNHVGKNCKIALSFDLHGQVTNKIIKNINYFGAYKTAPHIDIKKTYRRVTKMLINGILKNKNNYISWIPIPVLVSGEMSSTRVNPCKLIYKSLNKYNKLKGITDCNLLVGYVWADSSRATASAVVNSNNKILGDKICKKIATEYFKNRHKLKFDMNSGSMKKIFSKIDNKFTIIADSGDNPTAGGVGDRADVIKYVLNNYNEKILFAAIAAPKAFNKLLLKKTSRIKIGGDLGSNCEQFFITPDTVRIKNNCAIIDVNKITLIITKYRRSFHYLSDFKELGLNLNNYRVLIVKSGYLSPELQKLNAKKYMLLTDGAVNQNIKKLENKKRPKPMYPFNKINKFVAKIK
jgi:microcystin degradation protein MlrC